MKKILILTVMLLSVLALGFALGESEGSGTQTGSGGSLSGTYRCSATAYITFTGSNFTGAWGRDIPFSGTYSVSGSRLTLNITGGPRARSSMNWTVVNATTLRDQDTDIWNKEGGGTQTTTTQTALSGTYRYDANYYITFSGRNFTGAWGESALSGTFSVSGSRLTLNRSNGVTWNWTIVNANTLKDHDDDTWTKGGGTQTAFSGSYYREDYPWGFVFTDGKFYGYANSDAIGTYSVSGNRITINIPGVPTRIWTIVDANNVRDENGLIWKKTRQ